MNGRFRVSHSGPYLKENVKEMAEKILHEIRLVETDDGYRLEVKGDKERLKEMGFDPRMAGLGGGMMGFGPRMFFGRHRRGHRGHRRRGRFGHGHGPRGWWNRWDEEADEGEAPEKAPHQD